MFYLEKQKTTSTPYILADEAKGYLKISGESFPENVSEFYKDIVDWLTEFLEGNFSKFLVDFELVYFNSSSSKLFMNIMEMLDNSAEAGKDISVNWICDQNNDIIVECGEDFKEDFENLTINIVLM